MTTPTGKPLGMDSEGSDSDGIESDGSPGSLYTNGNQLGVSGSPRSTLPQVPVQIEYDRTTDSSESITLEFAGNMNQAQFSVDRLFSTENGGEQGRWVAMYDGHEVASDTFVLDSGIAGTFAIDTGGLVFNQIRFEAIDTANGTGDGSDYLLTGFEGNGPATANGAYTVSADQVLTVTAASPVDLLDNDSDADGDPLTVSMVNGSPVADGDVIVLPSGALLTIGSDGSFSYDPNGQFDGLAVGEVGADSFTYTVTDGIAGSDTATATITTVGVGGMPPMPALAGSVLVADALPTVDGGVGDNTLDGTSGAERFHWSSGDQGAPGTPAVDTVRHFDPAEGDALDLADLLTGEEGGDLTDFLHFEQDGANAVVHVSSNGGFAAGYAAGAEDQTIVLENVDLHALGSSDQEIVDALLAGNNLLTG